MLWLTRHRTRPQGSRVLFSCCPVAQLDRPIPDKGVAVDFFGSRIQVPAGAAALALRSNARILGASDRQLLRHVYVPSAMSWVFASLHNSVGLAFVGAVVGEYLGSSRGVGYLILQAEGTFDINSVFAGILVLTAFALLLDWMVTLAERRLLVWQPRGGETEKI